jgi:hypothetical protein
MRVSDCRRIGLPVLGANDILMHMASAYYPLSFK